VDVAPRFTYALVDVGQESDEIVADLGLDLGDALNGEGRLAADGLHGFGRDVTQLGLGLAGGQFHFQPLAVGVLRLPDGFHLRPCVTVDHSYSH
jgi:hypothetical protein